MSVTAKCLKESTAVGNTDTTMYTATNCRTIIDKVTATNYTGGAVTLSINMVPSAGAVASSNLILYLRSIAAGEDYLCPELVGQILNSGDFISMIASAGTSISVRISGREITG